MKTIRTDSETSDSGRVYHYERNHCEIETLVHQDSEDREIKMKSGRGRKNGCWYMLLLALLLLMLLICITLIILLIKIPSGKDKSSEGKIRRCQTAGCVKVAAQLLDRVNLSADPCSNFYDFACGGLRSHVTIPAEKEKWDTFEALEERKKAMVRSVIKIADRQINVESKAVRKLVDFYNSCINLTSVDLAGKKPLQDLIKSLGKWPLFDNNWDARTWDVTKALLQVHRQFFSSVHHSLPAPLFNSYIKVDDLNSTHHIMEVNQADLPLMSKDDYSQESTRLHKIRKFYRSMMVQLFSMLGANVSSNLDLMEETFKLEARLAKASLPPVMSRDVRKSYRKLTVEDFVKEVGNEIDWLTYFNLVTEDVGFKFTKSTYIGVRNMLYLKELNQILKETDKRVIANYIIWIVIYRFSSQLSSEFRQVEFQFQEEVKGLTKEIERWKTCICVVEEKMSMAVTSLFVRKAFQGREKEVAEEMLERMKLQLIKNIKNLEWMDEQTQNAAEAKAENMFGNIGYPLEARNATYLNQMYLTLHIDEHKYFQNFVYANRFQRIDNLNLLKQRVNRQLWDLAATLVDAYYDVTNNKMVFLGGIMGPPIFDLEAPMSLNFGALGAVMGHEMTHAFDDQGRLYDSEGNLKNWWTEKSAKAFQERAQCIATQYSNYVSYGLNVNGNQTLGENIADNGGVLTAFKAFQAWVKEYGEEPVLPGINLTQEQLFFLSSGQVWCGVYRASKVRADIKNGVHSPSRWRVTGPLSNIKEFAAAYKCPLGSPMNPEKKCKVW